MGMAKLSNPLTGACGLELETWDGTENRNSLLSGAGCPGGRDRLRERVGGETGERPG